MASTPEADSLLEVTADQNGNTDVTEAVVAQYLASIA